MGYIANHLTFGVFEHAFKFGVWPPNYLILVKKGDSAAQTGDWILKNCFSIGRSNLTPNSWGSDNFAGLYPARGPQANADVLGFPMCSILAAAASKLRIHGYSWFVISTQKEMEKLWTVLDLQFLREAFYVFLHPYLIGLLKVPAGISLIFFDMTHDPSNLTHHPIFPASKSFKQNTIVTSSIYLQ